jgi:RNA-directed DNA polymerase
MQRKKFKWRTHKNVSTDAGHRDGPERSSVEASVMEVERRLRVIQLFKKINQQWEESLEKAKPFAISKQAVWESYKRVKANRGAAGIDEVTLKEFEQDLKNNLFKLWNRMASGSYFPPAVKAVPIPKKSGGTRLLGVPTVADRIAQMVVKRALEPLVEPHFHKDSYGYRPGKSAHDALAETRKRCWRYDWVLEFDIRGLFDNIDHELLMRAVRKHTDCRWVILYIERWLTAPFQTVEGELVKRTKGTPQGGVVSPLLANLFLHYVFDVWMNRNIPRLPWARYADDGLVHCHSEEEAKQTLLRLSKRFAECGLELHPDKTRIVYCKDADRKKDCPTISFDFLGYTFRPRLAKNKRGTFFVSFLPAISNAAAKRLRGEIHDWRMHLKPDKSIEDLSRMFNPIIRGWINYYGRFYKSRLNMVLRHLNSALVHWVRRKYKRFSRHRRNAEHWLGRLSRRSPKLFVHWQMGILPSAG